MSNNQEIKRKISGINSTAKITKAMQLVSAVKMRKMQSNFLNSQYYVEGLREILLNLTANSKDLSHPLLKKNLEEKRSLIVLVGNSRGFVGAQISKLGMKFYEKYSELKRKGAEIKIVTVKRKALGLLKRYGIKSDYHFDDNYERLNPAALLSLKNVVIDGFRNGDFDSVYVVYTKFVTTATQEAVNIKFLPFQIEEALGETKTVGGVYKFEPGIGQILDRLISEYLEVTLYNIMLSASASEYSARMISMKNATDNANELSEEMTLEYNKTRQTAITQQIQEITNASFS